MKKMHVAGILLAALVAFSLVGAVSAEDVIPGQTTVEGTIIGFDPETGIVTILQEDGTIVTVNMGAGDYEHPIVRLLAAYFGEDNTADWTSALDTLAEELELEEGTEIVNIVPVLDAGDNIIGYDITVADSEDVESLIQLNQEEAEALADTLEALQVSLNATGDEGTGEFDFIDVGEQIAAYHEAGLGFGELVKIYTIALENASDCTEPDAEEGCVPATFEELVAYLADLVLNGTDMGTLFAEWGKPSLLGVGHVRQALRAEGGAFFVGGGEAATEGDGDGGGDGSHGVCNARAHGGNANANGQDIDC